MIGEPLVLAQIGNDQQVVAAYGRRTDPAARLADGVFRNAALSFVPFPFFRDHVDHGDRAAADVGGHLGDLVEIHLRRGSGDIIRGKGRQAAGFVIGNGTGHDMIVLHATFWALVPQNAWAAKAMNIVASSSEPEIPRPLPLVLLSAWITWGVNGDQHHGPSPQDFSVTQFR